MQIFTLQKTPHTPESGFETHNKSPQQHNPKSVLYPSMALTATVQDCRKKFGVGIKYFYSSVGPKDGSCQAFIRRGIALQWKLFLRGYRIV
jgi:hypothetical protein